MALACWVGAQQLDMLHDCGKQVPLLYYRAIVILTSRCVAVKDIQRAMGLLMRVSTSFFKGEVPALMHDPQFSKYAVQVANAIVEDGIVEPVYVHRPRADI